VVAIALGWDGTVLTRLSIAGTNRLEQSLLDKVKPDAMRGREKVPATVRAEDLPVEGQLPSLSGATAWLNSPALTPEILRGKVVLVDFWTYSCINCLRSLPYVQAWYEKYKDHGLVVLGVHAPEFAFEKDEHNVRRAVADLSAHYPVAIDNDYAIWRGFDNHYWPAHYFVDARGGIRGHHFGEGDEEASEATIRTLLTEAGYTNLPTAGTPAVTATGAAAAADMAHDLSGETYIGYRRASGFASPGGLVRDQFHSYTIPKSLNRNEWALAGNWADDPEKAVLRAAPGKIEFRFFARDLHLVLGTGSSERPVHFRVLLDGAVPGSNHGSDTTEKGEGVVHDQRLYQLIRQSGLIGEHVFSIEFEGGDVQAYAFTFG
jgi:thiol-disulfide isomerase/thioredoxin